MTAQTGLCQTWSKTQIVGFLMHRLILIVYLPAFIDQSHPTVTQSLQCLQQTPTEMVGTPPHVQGMPQRGAEVVDTTADGHTVGGVGRVGGVLFRETSQSVQGFLAFLKIHQELLCQMERISRGN